MKHSKWILSLAFASVLLAGCSSEPTKKSPSGPDCAEGPVVTLECLEGTWTMDPARNATASAVLAEDAAYAGKTLPLSIELGEDAISIAFTESDRMVVATHTLKPELNTTGYFMLEAGGTGFTFKGLWGSDPLEAAGHVMSSAKLVKKPDGFYLILGNGVFSRSPSGQVAEVFYRSLTDE